MIWIELCVTLLIQQSDQKIRIVTSKKVRKYVCMSAYVKKQVMVRLTLNEIQLDSHLVTSIS